MIGNHDQIERCGRLKQELVGYYPLLELVDNNISLILCHYPIVFYPHQRKVELCYMGMYIVQTNKDVLNVENQNVKKMVLNVK